MMFLASSWFGLRGEWYGVCGILRSIGGGPVAWLPIQLPRGHECAIGQMEGMFRSFCFGPLEFLVVTFTSRNVNTLKERRRWWLNAIDYDTGAVRWSCPFITTEPHCENGPSSLKCAQVFASYERRTPGDIGFYRPILQFQVKLSVQYMPQLTKTTHLVFGENVLSS